MQPLKNALKLASLAAIALLLSPTPASGQWANSRGGPERDGARAGIADLPIPQVKWRHELGGGLTSASLWQVSDPVAPRIAIAAGGRVTLKRFDDSLSWQGQLFGLSRFIGAGDLDADGVVGISDFLELLALWGQSGVAADLDMDGIVGIVDFLLLLANWG